MNIINVSQFRVAHRLHFNDAFLATIPCRNPAKKATILIAASSLKNPGDTNPKVEAIKLSLSRGQAFSSTNLMANLGFEQTMLRVLPPAEQTLLLIAFVLCTTVGVFSLLIIIALPMLNAMRRLSASMEKLSGIVHEEVPGTLAALNLSGVEINDLTQQLNSLRHKLQGGLFQRKDKSNGHSNEKGRDNPIMN